MVRVLQGFIAAPLLILAGCSSQQDKELAAVKSAHSITAEWAAVERVAGEKKVPGAYAGEMRDQAKQQLLSERKSLQGPAAQTVDAVQRAPSADTLTAAAARLDKIEKQLEAQ